MNTPVADDKCDHVTVSQCSVRSNHSDEECLPVLTPRNIPRAYNVARAPTLRYTNNQNQTFPHTSIKQPEDKEGISLVNNQLKPTPICRISQSNNKSVFLPRLTDAECKQVDKHLLQDEQENKIRFPEINVASKVNARLALNRSITDLLDPELEILNKIKHMPRKKRRKCRQRSVYHTDRQTHTSCQNSQTYDE